MFDKKNIEKLLEEENLPSVPDPAPLTSFDFTPSTKAIRLAEINKEMAEKREFARASAGSKSLTLKFSNEAQFAQQYIENISIGGLFVRTKLRPGVGAILPVEFSVPVQGQDKQFLLRAEVTR